jgi:D-alanyl-D-alanine carboxypeptidase/D-alanyl-D-alanine-endopeptidase (penicillin-binding protein 4)
MSRRTASAALCTLVVVLGAASGAQALDLTTLRKKLSAQQRHLSSTSGAYVRDLVNGRTLFSRNGDRTRSPASNEKLLVTGTALVKYGPDARLRTVLRANTLPVDGVIDGDVALVGVGDPYLATSQLRMIASQLVALGVEEIKGKILGDGSFFDRRRGSYDSGWAYDSDIGGSLGGLVVDYGRGTDPALYAAEQLRTTLKQAGIVVRKGAHAGRLRGTTRDLASVSSTTIAATIKRINQPSDNFAAEMLLKNLGATFGSAGSTLAGASLVRTTQAELGVTARLYDGSGLSRSDRVTPREVVDLLTAIAADPELLAVFQDSLPLAGRSGTLFDRMRGTAASGKCMAKTGTLNGVSALSGYCPTTSGDLVAFSFLENNMSAYTAKSVEDRMVPLIARFDGREGA